MRLRADGCCGIGNWADKDGGRGGAATGPSLDGTGGTTFDPGGSWEGAEIGSSAGAGMVITCP